MRKWFFLLLAVYGPCAMAQDVKSDYQTFREGVLSNYQQFRKEVLDDYAKYLQGVWDKYDEFRGAKRDVQPKPSTLPPVDDQPDAPLPLPVPKVAPQPSAPTVTPAPVKPLTPAVPTAPSSAVDFSFYGMRLGAPSCEPIAVKSAGHDDVAKAWEKYSKKEDMAAVVSSLQTLAVTYGLNDWFTFELVRTYSRKVVSDEASRVLLQHFILVNMGYDVRLASSDARLLLLVPFKQKVYSRSYIVLDRKKYYSFYEDSSAGTQHGAIYTCRLPQDVDKGRDLELVFSEGTFSIESGKKHQFSVSDGTITLTGTLDEGTMEALRHYPQMDVPFYAMSNIDADLRTSLLTQMRTQIQGFPEETAVGKLLHFVQHAFKYATDDEQHGYEKPYFVEENFYYPKNDCEDRAVLFAFFVHNLLGLDVHLVHFPGHECTAVNFEKSSVTGYWFSMDGKNFYICDPTYIGASIGQCMPEYRQAKPTVERWY